MAGAKYIAQSSKGYGVTHAFLVPAIIRKELVEMEKMGIEPTSIAPTSDVPATDATGTPLTPLAPVQ